MCYNFFNLTLNLVLRNPHVECNIYMGISFIMTRTVDKSLLSTYYRMPCVVCSKRPSDPSHIKSRGSGGHDIASNLIPLCRVHHVEQHKLGWITFSHKYPPVLKYLHGLGWEIIGINGYRKLCRTI